MLRPFRVDREHATQGRRSACTRSLELSNPGRARWAAAPAQVLAVPLSVGRSAGLFFVTEMGLVGQGARVLVGIKTLSDYALIRQGDQSDLFNLARLIFSLILGFVAGFLAGLAQWRAGFQSFEGAQRSSGRRTAATGSRPTGGVRGRFRHAGKLCVGGSAGGCLVVLMHAECGARGRTPGAGM